MSIDEVISQIIEDTNIYYYKHIMGKQYNLANVIDNYIKETFPEYNITVKVLYNTTYGYLTQFYNNKIELESTLRTDQCIISRYRKYQIEQIIC